MKKVIFSLVVVLCLRFLVTCDSPSSGSGSGTANKDDIPENAVESLPTWRNTTVPYPLYSREDWWDNDGYYYTLPYTFEELGYEGGYPDKNPQCPPLATKGTVITVNFTNTEITFSGIPEGKEILFIFRKNVPVMNKELGMYVPEHRYIGLKAGGSGASKKLVFTANEFGKYYGINTTNFKGLSVDVSGKLSATYMYNIYIIYPYRAVKLVVNGKLYNNDGTGTNSAFSIRIGPHLLSNKMIACSDLTGTDEGSIGWGGITY
jgi:hypothetical protein